MDNPTMQRMTSRRDDRMMSRFMLFLSLYFLFCSLCAVFILEEGKRTFDIPYSDPKLKKMKLLSPPTLGGEQLIKNYFKDKFSIEDIYGGIRQKGIVLDEIMKKYNLSANEVLYIGDDINDIPAMELVKYRIAPKNFNPVMQFKVENLQIAQNYGGSGAIREIADILVSME